MERGRPKLEIARTRSISVRLTEQEFQEIAKIAEKLKISKSEAVLRGIKLLANPPRKKIYRHQLPNFKPKTTNGEGITTDD